MGMGYKLEVSEDAIRNFTELAAEIMHTVCDLAASVIERDMQNSAPPVTEPKKVVRKVAKKIG